MLLRDIELAMISYVFFGLFSTRIVVDFGIRNDDGIPD